MSAAVFLVDEVPSADEFTLGGSEGHHAADVQRLQPGEELVLADGRGSTARARVTAARKGSLSLAIQERAYEEPARPALVVVQGIAKGDRGELAVQAMTEVGVDRIVPWSAARSVVQWRAERGDRARQRWADTAREAAKQARRAWVPEVTAAASTREVAAQLGAASLALVLHEEAATALSSVEIEGAAAEVLLVVGPEGGIAPDELAAFAGAGATVVRLGGTVLRTSTAGVAALSVLNARLGRW